MIGKENRNGIYVENCKESKEDQVADHVEECNNESAPNSAASSCFSTPARCIEHPVSKMDTLAGVAIKYGVEVADIKRMNGLVTDLQMFALKTLQIPLPGRHPPSPCLSNGHDTTRPSGSEHTPLRPRHSNILELFQSLSVTPERKVSQAMSSLQGYYGLAPTSQKNSSEGCEMAVYSKGSTSYHKGEPFTKSLPGTNCPLSHHRRSRSSANGFKVEDDELGRDAPHGEAQDTNPNKGIDKLVRRRLKSEADFTSRAPDKLIKENGGGGWFSAITGKGLALRSKAASRANLSNEVEGGGMNGVTFSLGDSCIADGISGFRKSSSTPSLQDQDKDNNGNSSIWATSKWSLKPDLQALSSAASAIPIFDGLPKPITSRRNKAALD